MRNEVLIFPDDGGSEVVVNVAAIARVAELRASDNQSIITFLDGSTLIVNLPMEEMKDRFSKPGWLNTV